MKSAVIILVFLSLGCDVRARCVMRGECYEVNGFTKPCPVDHDALPLNYGLLPEEAEQIVTILANRCPTLVVDENGDRLPNDQILTCCDSIQIRKMSDSLMLAEGILGRCPACLRNFARQICEMNCSPDQARFVDVYTETGTNNTEYVNEIDYRVHSDFMLNAHSSCSGVIVPQTGLPAINIMCGNAVVCDADAWFGFTGDTSTNPLAPVQVNFLRVETEEDSMNVHALACNETFEGDLPCSCVDCMTTCPTGNEPVVPEICTVFSLNCIGFSIGLIFFVLSVSVFIYATVREYRYMQKQDTKPDNTEEFVGANKLTRIFEKFFSKVGVKSSEYPVLVIMFTSWVAFAMVFGLTNLNLTSNPLELWSAPDSRSRHELEYFNSRFGPFYRAAQVFLTFDAEPFVIDNVTYGPAFRFEALEELVKLEDDIINIGRDNGGVTLEEVCYAPLRPRGSPPRLDQCVLMSASVYLGEDRNYINNNTYLNRIRNCVNNHYALNCLASWGGGAEPEISFGGYEGDNIFSANTLLINFPISNFLLEEDLRPVMEWELSFIKLLQDYEKNRKPDYISLAYGTERSIEDEIQRVSVAEVVPISISYILMFIYVTVSLGNMRSCKTWFIDSKVMVAISSIIIVLLSIMCAMGVMGYANITATLLAINVIPFFVLSVGIDNVFLMVNTLHDIQSNLKSYEGYDENFSFNKKRRFIFERMLGKVGPSMFVSSVTQVTCFAIGSLANFPAVVTFAIFASIAIGFLFVFQVTTIVAILSLDYKRSQKNRLDVFCCVQKKVLDDEDPLNSETPYKGVTQRLMEPYAKIIVNRHVKIVVAVLFMLMVSASIMMIPQIEIGLDQQLALPPDSYVYIYLQAVNDLMRIGPPVYFVVKTGLNFSNPDHQNVICGGQLCYSDSLVTQVFLAAQHAEITHISKSSNSWIDDFVDWSSLYGACCKYNTTDGTFCSSTDNSPECSYCSISRDEFANGLRPSKEAFQRYIPFFVRDEPTEICNKGGLASYFSAVNYILDTDGNANVGDTNFMAYHVPLGTSLDYINAVKYGYDISDSITNSIKEHTGLDVEVFPYSVFYVFYEQYLTMWADTFSSIAYCLIGATVFNLTVSGFNVVTSFAMMFTAVLVVINMMGVMYIWSIPLNAVSNINLIVSIGIAVEFSSHIAHAYATSTKGSKNERIDEAINSVGATIITGITLTNIPIIVLAFSYTEIISIFFFRMFFSVVILGLLHGMVFFPVLLSYLPYNISSKRAK